LRGVAEAPEPMDGREALSTNGENPGGIFERVPEKIYLAPAYIINSKKGISLIDKYSTMM